MVRLIDMGNKNAWVKSGETNSNKAFNEANSIKLDDIKYYRNMKYISCMTLEEAKIRVNELAKEPDNWLIVKYRNGICDHDLYLLNHYKEYNMTFYNIIKDRVNKSCCGKMNLEGYEYVLYTKEKQG